jgi:3-methyladenine DNA glycosylase AlkD
MSIRTAGDNRMEDLASEIRDYCRAHANPKLVQKYARYFREGYDAWGLLDQSHPFWNSQKAEWLERHRDAGLPGFLRLGELLFSSGKYEEGALAIQFLKEWRGQFQAKHLRGLARWFDAGVNNWAHTDVLCSEVLTPLLTSGTLSLDDFASWRESNLKYQRRAVPVAMLGLLKTTTDTRKLLSFIRPMMLDPERVVQQGLGWFLREAWKKNPEPVEAFLIEWKDRSPRLIFQYATEKMTPAARGRFRKTRT